MFVTVIQIKYIPTKSSVKWNPVPNTYCFYVLHCKCFIKLVFFANSRDRYQTPHYAVMRRLISVSTLFAIILAIYMYKYRSTYDGLYTISLGIDNGPFRFAEWKYPLRRASH